MDLSSKPKISDLMNKVAAKVPNKWMQIGIQLDIPVSQLEAFNSQHQGESSKNFIEVFTHWEKQPGGKPKTWSTVIDVLKSPSVAEVSLAIDLELTIITQNTFSSTNGLDNLQQSGHCACCTCTHDE